MDRGLLQRCATATTELGSCLTDATRDGRCRRAVLQFAAMPTPERVREQSSRLSGPVVPYNPPCLTWTTHSQTGLGCCQRKKMTESHNWKSVKAARLKVLRNLL